MNSRKKQAYLQLLQELLQCENTNKNTILNDYSDLIDEGLVLTTRELVQVLARENNPDIQPTIQWLVNFANELAETLEINIYPEISNPESELDLLMIAFQMIIESNSNPTIIYSLFQNNSFFLNNELINVIRSWAANNIAGVKRDDQAFVAALIASFGNLIKDFPFGDRAVNVEIALSCYQIVLETTYTPDTFPNEWAAAQNNLAIAYAERIIGRKADNIEIAIQHYKAALEVRTIENYPLEWATTINNLAVEYSNRIIGERSENLELAIQCYQASLNIRNYTEYPVKWAATYNNLALAYVDRIKDRRIDNIELAIKFYKESLMVRTHENFPQDWAATQHNLGAAYAQRILGKKVDNIELAIKSYQSALEVRSCEVSPQDWAATQHNLGAAYAQRILGKKVDNIELAIKSYQSALEVRSYEVSRQDWAMTQNGLGLAYVERIQGNYSENVEEAIVCYQNILNLYNIKDYPQDWAMTQNNLGLAYAGRIQGEHSDNIELAIACYNSSLQVRNKQDYPQDWAVTQHNLATTYIDRIRGERAENVELAIACYRAALMVRKYEDFPQDWAMTHNNLSIAYLERIRGEKSDNIELSIEYYNNSLKVSNSIDYPQDWAMTQNNLGLAYAGRIQGKKEENLELAIVCYQASLKVRSYKDNPQDWAITQNNLAVAYFNRVRGNLDENIELAICCYKAALKVKTREAFPQDWAMLNSNLALAYTKRIQGKKNKNIKLATQLYHAALEVRTCNNSPRDCHQTSLNLGDLHFQEQKWNLATIAYQNAFDAAQNLYQSCILLNSKSDELKEIADLPRRIAYGLVNTGELQKAVEVLEQNRARGLSESLDRDRANLTQLQQINNELYEKYRDITNQLRNIEAQQRDRITSTERHSLTPETMRDTATQLRQQLDDLIQAIRQVQGYENFLTLPTFADVRHAISQIDRPLIYLLCTSAGSLALIVTPENINTVWCDNFTETQLATLIETWFAAYNQRQTNHSAWLNTIDAVTRQLWEPLMAPLLDQLAQQQIDRAVLIPTGYLSLLPLHAAWTEDPQAPSGRQYVIDCIHFTYAPNAKSLTAAQAIATKTIGNDILAIDNPTQDLPNAQREIQQVTSYFEQPKILQGATAQAAIVLDQLPNYQYIHLACHGTADLNEPLKSGLRMSDRLLTLKEFLALKLGEDNSSGIRLAVLSACETALPGTENTDEAISLPTGLLQAGVAGIIASLWAVDDSRTMLLLTKFYELWQGAAALPIDVALYQSQLWLRNITEKDLAALIGQRTLTPEKYQHLYYWAAFSYTGI
jgi:CHAT domain-containing protein